MSALVLRNFMASIIEYPKVLVAAVNGPAIGIAATMLGVFDAVYLSDQALLRTPLHPLAQCSAMTRFLFYPDLMHLMDCKGVSSFVFVAVVATLIAVS